MVVLMSKDAVERYDLAAKCYRQALNCVKETPALGEREKASKTQEIQVTIVVLQIRESFLPPLEINLLLQGLLKELRTKVTESDLGEDEAGEEVAGSQAAGVAPERLKTLVTYPRLLQCHPDPCNTI